MVKRIIGDSVMETDLDVERNERGSRIFITELDPKRIHIIARPDGKTWAVKPENSWKATAVFATLEEAIKNVNNLNIEGKEVILHRDMDTYEYL